MRSSLRAFNLLVEDETGGRVRYDKRYRIPDYPGGRAGVRIGIEYDCGYETADQIVADCGAVLNRTMMDYLVTAAGVKGPPARAIAHEIAHAGVEVVWEQALQIFRRVTLPQWEIAVESLHGSERLSPDSFGALVALAFSRDASWDIPAENDPTNRYREMRQIKADLAIGNISHIPLQIRSMRRLWPSSSGLRHRRDHEAALFEAGMGS